MSSRDEVPNYSLHGPLLKLSEEEAYLLTEAEYAALDSVRAHNDLSPSDKSELTNLRLIAHLQRCKSHGFPIDLAHFEQLHIQDVERVKVMAQEMNDGSLLLMPDYGEHADFDSIKNRLWQLKEGERVGSLRVENNRLVLDEAAISATEEVLSNKRIAPEQVEAFIKNPAAFINGALVDLDEGYSLRVQGATEFKAKFFGDTDESGISWSEQVAVTLQQPSHLKTLIKSETELDKFREIYELAIQSGASCVEYKEQRVDISNAHQVDRILDEIEDQLTSPDEPGGMPPEPIPPREPDSSKQLVLDIYDNDVNVEFGATKAVESILHKDDIDWTAYKFTPFKYQKEGVRWILGLSNHTYDIGIESLSKYGALLADDMGLGKTFMSLAAIKEYLDQSSLHDDKSRPVLIVAPLSLLENWEEEISRVFHEGRVPFSDIVKLQANADLPRYRVGGAEIRQAENAKLGTIRHSLKIGKAYLQDRLDKPRRLVLTTYETLRDYQFSLCRVDWSIVVFDEAQYMKNPNTLAAIAAKGLKARFKLIMTGTPVENSLRDFWNLMDTAVPAYLGSWQDFRQTYVKPINDSAEEHRGQARLEQGQALRACVGPLMLRRIKEGELELEGLPQKRIFSGNRTPAGAEFLPLLCCEMPKEQQKTYEMVIDLVQEGASSDKAGSFVLAGLHQLRAVSLHPDLLEGGMITIPSSKKEAEQIIARSGKLAQTFKLLHEIENRGEKVIIFCINKRLQSFLKTACQQIFEINVGIVNGDTKAVAKRKDVATRRSILSNFEAGEGFGVVVMSPIAAGVGLTVVGANNVVHLERHWNPAKEAQATDRVYRIGQERDVNVYLPILVHPTPDVVSFDENLDKLLQQKIALKDAVVTPEDVSPEEMGADVFKVTFDGEQSAANLSIEDVDKLSWERFESFCAELLGMESGGEPSLTAKGPDHGADVVITGAQNILIQCKHTLTGALVGAESVREVYAAKPTYEDRLSQQFSRLIVVTNAEKIEKRAKQAANECTVEIISRAGIRKLLAKHDVAQKSVSRRLAKERLKV